jgi:GTP cyclohydrolase I
MSAEEAMAGIAKLMELCGVKAEGELAETPDRVVRAHLEMTAGYAMNPAEILSKRFVAEYDEMVVLRDIAFVSLCEHHLLPFVGVAAVAYIPTTSVVGLSKLARLVHCFAMRFQMQERMTREIADALQAHLAPRGVGVIVRASHQCMTCRGVRATSAEMVTSALHGVMTHPEVRAEFLRLTHAS